MNNWLVLFAISILCFVGLKPCEDVDNGLSMESSRIIKGIASLFLVCIHIGNSLKTDGAFGILSGGGYLLVSLFFFYSGYGIFLGLKKKTDSSEIGRYLLQHIWKLVKLMIVTEFIYFAVYALFGKITITPLKALLCISGWQMLAGQMWYILALIIIYAGMLLLSIINPQWTSNRMILAIFGVVLYIAYVLLRGRQFHELQSCIAFLIGGLMCDCTKLKRTLIPTENLKRKAYLIVFISVFILANAMIYLVRYFYADVYAIRVLCGWLSVICFIGIVMNLLSTVTIRNSLFSFIGTLFTWIYLSHQVIINVMEWSWPSLFSYKDSTLLSFGILGITIAISYAINRLILIKT